ncbi:hypothetical protein [Deefgea rivuli]|uniref:hypothetical protein n=1 Tax=Deefgea rivuli TaxID=400948 RepID=UPI00048858A4|nr:hypothetical protein [Deefgea rivuli]
MTNQYQYGKDTTEFSSISGAVLSPQIQQRSSTRTDSHFWIKVDEEYEHEVYLSHTNLPLRQGQEVTVIFAKVIKGSRYGRPEQTWAYLGGINHTTQRSTKFEDTASLRHSFHLRDNKILLNLCQIFSIIGIALLIPPVGVALGVVFILITLPNMFNNERFHFDFMDYHFKKKPELNALIDQIIFSN